MKSKIALVIIVLTLIVGVTAFINLKSVEVKKDLEENSKFVIKENGEEVVVLNMKEISSLGEKDFKANFKKNGKKAVSFNYTGVPFKNILNKYNISLDDKSAIIFTAIDGYTVAVEIEKILEDNNVYLTYMKEGEPLGNKENGGSGPYQMIISKDPFSQYWCKFAIEADVQ